LENPKFYTRTVLQEKCFNNAVTYYSEKKPRLKLLLEVLPMFQKLGPNRALHGPGDENRRGRKKKKRKKKESESAPLLE